MQLRAARPPAARDSQPEMLFSQLYSDPAAPRGARRPRAARRGAPGREAAQLVCRTLDVYPFTATHGLETLRGAKAVALPARARTRAVFICKSTPCFFVEQDQARYGTSLHLRSVPGSWPLPDLAGQAIPI